MVDDDGRRSIPPKGQKPKVCVELWNEFTGDKVVLSRGPHARVDVASFIEAPSTAVLNRDTICRSSSAVDADTRVVNALNGGRVLPYREIVSRIDRMTFSVVRFLSKIIRKALWNQRVTSDLISRLALRACDRSRSSVSSSTCACVVCTMWVWF